MDDVALESMRIDKWLWAARFFKTRSLATQAVSGGHIQVAEQRVKASRRLRRGETVQVRRGVQAWDVVVRGLREERRPAPEAQTLYEETRGVPASRRGASRRGFAGPGPRDARPNASGAHWHAGANIGPTAFVARTRSASSAMAHRSDCESKVGLRCRPVRSARSRRGQFWRDPNRVRG